MYLVVFVNIKLRFTIADRFKQFLTKTYLKRDDIPANYFRFYPEDSWNQNQKAKTQNHVCTIRTALRYVSAMRCAFDCIGKGHFLAHELHFVESLV